MFFFLAIILSLSNAQQCTQTMSVCLEQCECCDSGIDIKGDCPVSLVQHINICSGEGSPDLDPSAYILESKSIQTKQWTFIQEGDLIFLNRIYAVEVGESTLPRECIQIPVNMDKFQFEHRITFPTQQGGDIEFSGAELHGTCGSEVCMHCSENVCNFPI